MLVYLASTSPRRRQLLSAAGIDHRVVEPGPEPEAAGSPQARALARATLKAVGACPGEVEPGLIVGADTVVDVDGEEFGKPRDAQDAARMLAALQGREHRVHTAICVRRHPDADAGRWAEVASSTVRFAALDPERIRRHVESGAWRGKAGGYGIQDPEVAGFGRVVDGSIDTVVGLCVALLRDLLDRAARGEA